MGNNILGISITEISLFNKEMIVNYNYRPSEKFTDYTKSVNDNNL